ncbi:MAG: hypothetical protein INR69_15720 [Mucilaginibacter polytrichastri]|nr:hypothetical protein [Mucilaginibacter polytrichastri]
MKKFPMQLRALSGVLLTVFTLTLTSSAYATTPAHPDTMQQDSMKKGKMEKKKMKMGKKKMMQDSSMKDTSMMKKDSVPN